MAQEILRADPLKDHPGCWLITRIIPSESGEWSAVRKPDGTFWEVAEHHTFHPDGGDLKVVLGNQISSQQELDWWKEKYNQLKTKLEELQ